MLAEACEWAAGLTLDRVPGDVRRLGEAQALSVLGAVRSGWRHPVGERIGAAGSGGGWIERAALDAMASMALDYDETVFAGHTGHSCVLVPLALEADLAGGAVPGEPASRQHAPGEPASRQRAPGDRALLASIAATEVAARVTAALTLGRARGQTAAHTHLAGAAIGAGVMLGLTSDQLLDALCLSLAQPVRVLHPAFMGSDAKLGVAAGPIRLAGAAVLQARAGMRGPRDLMERPGGLLEELSEVPLPEAFGGWDERWHLRSLSVKAVPGCAYLSAAVDAAIEIAAARAVPAQEVDEVAVDASIFTLRMEAEAAPFVRGPDSPLAALNFSVGYSVATALLEGDLRPHDFHGEPLRRPERWELAARVRLAHDPAMTLRALGATAPVGAALGWAGERARDYLLRSGAGGDQVDAVLRECAVRGPEHFDHPTKEIGARVRVRLRDGRELVAERRAARGSCGESVAARLALARAKAEGVPAA
ncbi:MAG TPA: MmgE/PrpD family protein [Candidatus Dormibacteraeota bacterium]|jgi:2-methylcitrate dehydratase PrpD|nr:MmgE/PrpD family protein [Candidatus Dormibacteraeota bacterium]